MTTPVPQVKDDILRDAPESVRADFEAEVVWGDLKAGEGLERLGIKCLRIAFVQEGSLRVYQIHPDGHEVTLYRVGPGEVCVLSAASILGNTGFPAVMIAEGPTRVGWVRAERFRAWVGTDPWWRERVFGWMGAGLGRVLGQLSELTFQRVERRLADLVLRSSVEGNGPLKRTHQELARELCTAREVVSRILGRWREAGWVRLGRGVVEVIERESLLRAAHG